LGGYGHAKKAALAALDEAESAVGGDVALDRARAKIYWRDDKFAVALDIWRRIADRISRESAVERAFSLREAAINAAKAGDWVQSEKWFADAEKSAAASDLDGMESMSIGLNAGRRGWAPG
jgi:hypothetical protein